ncbi:hypothetical protein [Hymenobacter guriensis]|uniref:Uncharacterized protein n=1 Tax=Hymenobacter guriensis TaxID=2793065 RepID=A0ABS0L9E6_9BACT|nr:hypothetical protein [Hymenobacter guriensis]MBG8556288.1 hypothetical protein [Hymenobacter guriensis]
MSAPLRVTYARQSLLRLQALPLDSPSQTNGQALLELVATTIQHAQQLAQNHPANQHQLQLLQQVSVLRQQQQTVLQQLEAGQGIVGWAFLRASLKVTLELLQTS